MRLVDYQTEQNIFVFHHVRCDFGIKFVIDNTVM